MASIVSENEQLSDPEAKVVSSFIYELNVSRRHACTYPKSHPIIASSTQKVLSPLRQFLALREELTIGVTRESLLVGTQILEQKNPLHREFAGTLFKLGVASVSFGKGLQQGELQSFCTTLGLKPERFLTEGGWERVLSEAGIRNIRVRQINYDVFKTTEEELIAVPADAQTGNRSEELWRNFVRGVMSGQLDPARLLFDTLSEVAPEALAEILNQEVTHLSSLSRQCSEMAVTGFLKQLEGESLTSKQRLEFLDKLGDLVGKLNPGLRSQMLESTFTALAERSDDARQVLSRLPDQVILETLEEVSSQQRTVPPLIMGLVQKLAAHAPARPAPADPMQESGDRLRVIFREDNMDAFVPGAYQDILHDIVNSESMPRQFQEEIERLKETLSPHSIEIQISSLILDIIASSAQAYRPRVLQRNLMDLIDYFLGMGDYASLVTIFDRLSEPASSKVCTPMKQQVLAAYSQAEFIEDVLNGVSCWGKALHPQITRIIQRVGAPFAEPLLDRLAEEPSMSLRQFYMSRLIELGEPARDAIVLRLRDPRWYYVRNLLVMLRALNDPSVLPHTYRLAAFPHPKVRHEQLKTLLHFQDPEGERMLLSQMDGDDQEARLSAVLLSEKSRTPQVFQRLLGFLQGTKYSGHDLELKTAAVRALADIGDPAALPHLERILKANSIFQFKGLRRLKIECVASLAHYPVESVAALLAGITHSRNSNLAQQARDVLARLFGREA